MGAGGAKLTGRGRGEGPGRDGDAAKEEGEEVDFRLGEVSLSSSSGKLSKLENEATLMRLLDAVMFELELDPLLATIE